MALCARKASVRGMASADFHRRIQLHARPARDIGQLQAVDRALREVVAAGHDQRLGIEPPRRRHVPTDFHALGVPNKSCEAAAGAGSAGG